MWLQTGSPLLSWNTPVLPNDSKSWEQVRSFSCGNVAIQTFGSSKWQGKCLILLNWNLKDCRKHRKQQLVEEKTDLFTVSRNFVLRIEFCSSKHIFWVTTGGQRQASSVCHKYCPLLRNALYSLRGAVIPPFYRLLHCTCWMRALAFWTRLLKTQLRKICNGGWGASICRQPGDLSSQSRHPLSEGVLVWMALRG